MILFSIISPSLFNCYTFIRGRRSGLLSNHGLGDGLSLVLYMEASDYSIIQNYDDGFIPAGSTGFRVLLTPPNHLAAMGFAGYEVTPGYTTSIGFDITEHLRLSEPYSECRRTENIRLDGNLPYSYVECRNLCIHEMVKKECGCYPTRYVTRKKNI